MRAFRSATPLLFAFASVATPAFAGVSISVSASIAPPPLRVYAQPVCPGDGYIWTPGYWAYGSDGYFWVPGAWVMAPVTGYLWTPAYWGWSGGFYVFHHGYWGPHVGFYGGINYGCGYGGSGYEGGYWNSGRFYYNRSVNNVTNVHVTNVYYKSVVRPPTINRVSYNGGEGGLAARPTPQEHAVENERHIDPTRAQVQRVSSASTNRRYLATDNHEGPASSGAATARPSHARDDSPGGTPDRRIDPAPFKPTGIQPTLRPNAPEPRERNPMRAERSAPRPEREKPPRREPDERRER